MSKHLDQCRRVELERLNQYMEQVKIELIQTNEILKEEAGVKEERIVMFEKRLNEAAAEKIRLEQQTEQLLQELHNEREDNKNLRGKINELENICECRRREISVQQAQTEHEEGIKKLNLTKSRDDLRDRVEGEKDSMTDFSDAVSGRMPDSSRTNLKNKNRTKKEASRETERRLKELKEKYVDEIFIMQQKLTEVKKENAKLREEAQTPQGHHKDEMKTKELKEKLDRREKQLQKLRVECDELKTRNPDLTDPDLSDENKATKLAERYSELYDNQWTDAFEEIQSHLAPHQYNNETVEKKAISILLQALKEAMQFCECEIKEQDIHIKDALLRGSKIKMELPEAFVYQLKQTKKFLADKTVDVVCQNFLARKSSIENFPTYKIETFVTECVKISWLMVNHDPPIALDVTAKPGDSFDSKKYKEYTKRGPKIDFLVWPPMQIEGHSLLMEGIAQGKPEFVEETEIYPMKKTVASRLNVQTGTRKNDADDRVNTVAETTKKYTDSTGVAAFMHTENYDMSSSRRPRAVYTDVDQRYDGTGSTTQGYKTQYHNTLPSKAEYGYQSQKYTKVNDVAPQTLRIQGWGHEAAYKQSVTRQIYQTSDKTYGMSPTYPIYDTPNETEWARYLYYKKKNRSREYIKINLGEPSFNRCENYECYQK